MIFPTSELVKSSGTGRHEYLKLPVRPISFVAASIRREPGIFYLTFGSSGSST